MLNNKKVNKNQYIAVYDSGIGGLNVLKLLKQYLPYENYLYFGDNQNAPYGNKSPRSLTKLAIKNIKELQKYGVKGVVLACNTLSTVSYKKLKKRFKIKFIKTLPPIKDNFYNDATYLICTQNTANSKFVKKHKNNIKVMPAIDLATKIEHNVFNLKTLSDDVFEKLKKANVNTLILGCTHYAFLLKRFYNALPNVQIVQPEYLSMLSLNEFLNTFDLKNNSCYDGKIEFIGQNALYNKSVYENFCLKKH